MKALALTSWLLAAVPAPVSAQPGLERFAVAVDLVGDDGLTLRLSASLEDALRKHPRLQLADGAHQAQLTIRSDSNVGWDKLEGRVVVIYTVYVEKGATDRSAAKRHEPITGICYELRMSKCVNDILRVVEIDAEDP